MHMNHSNIFVLTLGSVVGLLAILSANFPASIAGYSVLTLGLLITFVVTIHEGRPLSTIREGVKAFVAFGLIFWVVAVFVAAVLAALA